MSAAKPSINLASEASPRDATDVKPIPRPKILKGRAMPPVKLPLNFDLSVHRKILATGATKSITRSELAERITLLKKRKNQLG